jgi:hypothetical protein
MESTDAPPVYEVKSQQSYLTQEDAMKLMTKSAQYYKQRPAWTGLSRDLVIKFDGNFSFWSVLKQMWMKDDYLFKECMQGHMERITHDEAMKMIEERKK